MFGPLSSTIQGVVNFTWPMVLISTVIIVSLRIAYILKNHAKFVLYQDLLMLSFIIYVLCLFQVVTFQDNNNISSNNLIPFREMFRYDLGSRLFLKNVLGNIIMFLPYGFFTSYFLKEKKLLPIFILTVLTSLTIESTQLMIGRVFDIDDILLNILGGVLGHYLYILILKIGDMCPSVLQREWFLNLVSIILLVGLITLL